MLKYDINKDKVITTLKLYACGLVEIPDVIRSLEVKESVLKDIKNDIVNLLMCDIPICSLDNLLVIKPENTKIIDDVDFWACFTTAHIQKLVNNALAKAEYSEYMACYNKCMDKFNEYMNEFNKSIDVMKNINF